jgi:uncharacterized membrane protein
MQFPAQVSSIIEITQIVGGPEVLGVAILGVLIVAWLLARTVDTVDLSSPQ